MTAFELHDEFNSIVEAPLTEKSVRRALDIIKYIGEIDGDDEVAHSQEDSLRTAVLRQINDPLAKMALESEHFEFSRWCS